MVVADGYAFWLLEWIPCYYTVKLCVYVWLQMPGRLMGARIIYKGVFAPLYAIFGPTLNYYVNRTHEEMYDFNKEVNKNLTKMQGAATNEFLK